MNSSKSLESTFDGWVQYCFKCLYFTMALNPFPNKVLRVCSTSLLKTLWQKKLLKMSNFSDSNSVFNQFLRTFCYFYQIWNCRLEILSVWKSLKFVVWERVKIVLYLPNDMWTEAMQMMSIFVAFVEDNATMSSIPYFENLVSYFVQNRRK